MSRLFIAIDIPERIKDDIIDTYFALHGARWVEEAQLHLTLRFIGEVSGDMEGHIKNVLRQIRGQPFSLQMKSVGFFPPRNEPKVLWAGIAEHTEITRLQARIERALTGAGLPPDSRKFHPHITIARLTATHPQQVALFVTQNSLFATEEFSVSSFHLYSSILRKDGAVHIKEASYTLDNEEL